MTVSPDAGLWRSHHRGRHLDADTRGGGWPGREADRGIGAHSEGVRVAWRSRRKLRRPFRSLSASFLLVAECPLAYF